MKEFVESSQNGREGERDMKDLKGLPNRRGRRQPRNSRNILHRNRIHIRHNDASWREGVQACCHRQFTRTHASRVRSADCV